MKPARKHLARKHLPVVHPDERYEANYAARKTLADEAAADLAAAIAACGPDAGEYGRHVVHDKLGLEPSRVIYCRRDDGVWSPPSPECEERILKQSTFITTPGGMKYETRAVTVPEGRFAEHAVTHFIRRYEVSTAPLPFKGYKPQTPEQMKAAAERRRAKALAELEAEERAKHEADEERRRVQPSLFPEESA